MWADRGVGVGPRRQVAGARGRVAGLDGGVGAGAHGRAEVGVGARGGVGTSTVAMNCAWLMAHEQSVRVSLVDLDLQFGTAALSTAAKLSVLAAISSSSRSTGVGSGCTPLA